MLRWFFLIILALLTYLSALVFYLPAGWLWQWVTPQIQLPPGLVVDAVVGRLWQGQAIGRWQQQGLALDWSLDLGRVLRAELPIHLAVTLGGAKLKGDLTLALPDRWQLNVLPAELAMSDLAWLWRDQGSTLDGSVTVSHLSASGQGLRWSDLRGQGGWTGGYVTWPMGGSQGEANFPPMDAVIETLNAQAELRIKDAESPVPAIVVQLTQDGLLQMLIHKRLLELSGQPWGQSAASDAVVFRMRQQLPMP